MTYLDPDQADQAINWPQLIIRVLAIAAVVAFGWFALTLGSDNGSARPEIAQEPTADGATAQ